MKYCFCTISIGEDYVNSVKKFIHDLNVKCENNHFVLITNSDLNFINNTTIGRVPNEKKIKICNQFNYNLKYLPIKLSHELNFDYIIYVDSDWAITDEFSEEKLYDVFKFMDENAYDLLYERPHTIGEGKFNEDCFWKHKRDFYDLLNTNLYDKGQVVNEQFLIFKNSNKIKKFIDEWEKLEKIASDGDLWAFAEGVEIGMSSCVADLNMTYSWRGFLNNSFSFLTKDGRFYQRF